MCAVSGLAPILQLHEDAIRRLFADLQDASDASDKAQLAAAIKNLQTALNDGLAAARASQDALQVLAEQEVSKLAQSSDLPSTTEQPNG